ncbi:hypothetical protein F511_15806 [Dorcoceras hygrometricum]|uniref:Histidine-containing phosphotransfer protein n=1 Tax=Dorcoceras hygrometricum TaxID=472368 RepID=A0A2Z7DCH4_9LAMI|nr:hypothetical protein F511_15806 [Dorcoceras hygrometricum]
MLGFHVERLLAEMNRLLALLFHQGVLDEQFLQLQLLQDESSPNFVSEVVNIYFHESEKLLKNLRGLLADRELSDYKRMGVHLNQLMGSSSSIGAKKVWNVCVAFRAASDQTNWPGCLRALELLEYEYCYLKNKLHELFHIEQQRSLASSIRYPEPHHQQRPHDPTHGYSANNQHLEGITRSSEKRRIQLDAEIGSHGNDQLEDFDYNDPRCNPFLRPAAARTLSHTTAHQPASCVCLTHFFTASASQLVSSSSWLLLQLLQGSLLLLTSFFVLVIELIFWSSICICASFAAAGLVLFFLLLSCVEALLPAGLLNFKLQQRLNNNRTKTLQNDTVPTYLNDAAAPISRQQLSQAKATKS